MVMNYKALVKNRYMKKASVSEYVDWLAGYFLNGGRIKWYEKDKVYKTGAFNKTVIANKDLDFDWGDSSENLNNMVVIIPKGKKIEVKGERRNVFCMDGFIAENEYFIPLENSIINELGKRDGFNKELIKPLREFYKLNNLIIKKYNKHHIEEKSDFEKMRRLLGDFFDGLDINSKSGLSKLFDQRNKARDKYDALIQQEKDIALEKERVQKFIDNAESKIERIKAGL